MKDELVGIVVAKLAKDKKFLEVNPYPFWFHANGKEAKKFEDLWNVKTSEYFEHECILRPTQSLLQRWLRETQEIHVEVISKKYKTKIATCIPRTFKYIINGTYSLTVYNTYEEALEEGLLQGLKLI